MRKILPLFIFILAGLAVSINSSAQCKNFARKICKLDLTPYIHDGNYTAAILTEGEEADFYKTLPDSGRCQPAVIDLANHLIQWVNSEHPAPAVRAAWLHWSYFTAIAMEGPMCSASVDD